MLFFIRRIGIAYVFMTVGIVLALMIGRGLNAPIVAIDESFFDIRTRILYDVPAPSRLTVPQFRTPSPDGQHYFQISRTSGGQIVTVSHISGERIARFEPDDNILNVAALWMDSNTLLLMRQLRILGTQHWSVYQLDTGEEHRIGSFYEPLQPQFSPDGKWLVSQPTRDESRMLLPVYASVISIETQYQLGETKGLAYWSPDSRWFAVFAIKVDNSQLLQVLDVQTGTIHDNPIQPDMMLRMEWTSDSDYLVIHDRSNLWIVQDGDVILHKVMTGLQQVKLSQDDKSILIIRNGDNNALELYTMTIPDNESLRLLMTLPENYVDGSSFWTYDNQQITHLVEASLPELHAIDVASQKIEFLGTLPQIRWRNRIQVVSPDFIEP